MTVEIEPLTSYFMHIPLHNILIFIVFAVPVWIDTTRWNGLPPTTCCILHSCVSLSVCACVRVHVVLCVLHDMLCVLHDIYVVCVAWCVCVCCICVCVYMLCCVWYVTCACVCILCCVCSIVCVCVAYVLRMCVHACVCVCLCVLCVYITVRLSVCVLDV